MSICTLLIGKIALLTVTISAYSEHANLHTPDSAATQKPMSQGSSKFSLGLGQMSVTLWTECGKTNRGVAVRAV